MEIEKFDNFINSHTWTFSKSMPKTPHEYICKDYLDEESKKIFEEVVLWIREVGFTAKFFRKSYIYFKHEDWYYWTMGNPIEQTKILNRANEKFSKVKKYNGECYMEIKNVLL